MDMCKPNQFCFLNEQEFLAVREGIKPVMRQTVTRKLSVKKVKNMCKKNNLHTVIKSMNVWSPDQQPVYHIFISKSSKLAKEAYQANKKMDSRKLGELLGYPECCIDNFIKLKNTNPDCQFILHSFFQTKTKPRFYANDILNFSIRKFFIGRRINQANENFIPTNHFLISHIPCSYDCKESIKMGRNVLKILIKESNEHAKKIAYALKKPFLVFDDFNWVVFDGNAKSKEKAIEYKKILATESSYPENKLKMFMRGDTIKINDENITILKDDEILNTIGKDNTSQGIVIDFR